MHSKIDKISSYQNIILFASILPIIIFGFLIYNTSKEERLQTTSQHIINLNEQKKNIAKNHFKDVQFHTSELAKTITYLQEQATRNIINIQELQKNNLQNHYHQIENEILSLAKKDMFQYIFSFLDRSKNVELRYLENIYDYKKELKIANVLMIDKNGKILYSSDDESLLKLNADELIDAFKGQQKVMKASFVMTGYKEVFKEYKQYAVAPFKDVDGYIAIEISQEIIDAIIANVASLGSTAETYLIYKNDEQTYLASNRDKKIGKIGDEKFGTHINMGFTQTGVDIKYGSLGDIELVGHTPINVKNITLSMQTTIAYTEIISPTIDGSDYFEQFIRDYNYRNVMLVGPNGDIFYSVLKEADYKTNILTGRYSNSSFSRAVKDVFHTKKFVLTDIDYYEASENKIGQFALKPILRDDGTIQSIVVLELNLDTLSEKFKNINTIYASYDSYIVGEDFRLRSNSTYSSTSHTVKKSFNDNVYMNTLAIKKVFSDKDIPIIVQDYKGMDVLASLEVLEFSDFSWLVVSKIDTVEVEEMLGNLKVEILIFILISSVIALIIMSIITNEKKKQDKKIHYTATHDPLTALPNRRFALEYLKYILAHAKRKKNKGAVLFIDLDKFKVINDSYGHQTGDLVLKEVALRLKKVLRQDDLIARLGGDEFILIVSSYASLHAIDVLCKKIIEEISLPIKDNEKVYQVGMSIGVATFPQDSQKAEELLQFADTAMFKTKDNGRNGFTYYSKEMTEQSLKVSRVEEDLKKAINLNELVLYYQPQVSLENTKVVGVEALVRWNHPQDGLLMPNDFIPIAEESNLILDLGYWVLYEACENFKKFKDNGCELEYIAVNMSTKQLECPHCIKNIQTIFDTLDFKPEWLELEITETTLIANLDTTIKHIELFKAMGVKFSIDDFGTGYSSLSYLKSLQISTLKIDREFIKDMIEDRSDRAIVEAIILMGHTLNYTIVAEGVETEAEVILLKYLACDVIQGYYFSRPLPEKELLTYIKGLNNA